MAGWLARNAALTVPAAALAYLLVWPLGEAGLVDEIVLGDYLFVLFFAALMWPLYMVAVAVLSRRRRHRFRRWAVGLAPMLGALLTVGLLFLNVPEILAAWLFFVLYGLVVRPR